MKIIFLPGLGQDATAWNKVIENLNINLEPESLNLFSTIDDNTKLTFELLHREIAQKLQVIDEPYILCGLSLGAILALSSALDGNRLVKGLILSGAQFESPNKLLIDLQNLMFRFMPSKNFIELGITKKQMIAFCQSMKSLNLRPKLDQLNMPTAIICGTKDKANLPASKALHAEIRDSEIKVIDGGHMLNEETPVAFTKIINEFYAKYFSVREQVS
ncbi:alpha/beta fold hydrolase [Weissella paramesenteroides]|uniref:alpha/beta fold hydrolase n=1 Tax=Weissella paramesenteroides TaxID=1249 RepID=UPI003F7470F2